MGQVRTKVIETAIDPEHQKKIEEIEKKKPVAEYAPSEKKKQVHPPKSRGKRYKQLSALVDKTKEYPLEEAIELAQKTANTKFDSSIEAHINLGLSAEKQEHQIRTSVTLPHQVGKKTKMVVFSSKQKEEIKKLGAEIGTETTLKEIEAGKVKFDKIIADSTWMPKLAKVAKVLGPKGMMPNPKSGTVTDDPVSTLKEFSKGKMELKTEKFPVIHLQIGKVSFKPSQLKENYEAVINVIHTARPEGFKKALIKSTYLCTTMGPSIKIQTSSLN